MPSDTEEKVLGATRGFLIERGGDPQMSLSLDDAVCQDLMIFGVDVEDYVGELEKDLGPVVWSIPWGHFTDQTSSFRGCGILFFPPWFLWRSVRSLVVDGPIIPRANPKQHPHRLTIGDIASAIEAGGWPVDCRPK